MMVRQKVARLEDFLRAPKEGFLEICGLAGTGKTKLMMDACCRLAISSGPPVVYLDTEGGFDVQSFENMVSSSTCSAGATRRALEKVLVYRIFDGLELQSIISDLSDRLTCHSHQELPFRALFVDSIAFPFRCDFRRLQDCCESRGSYPYPPTAGPRGSIDAGIRRRNWCQTDACTGEVSRTRLLALMDVAKWLRDIAKYKIPVVVSNHLTETQAGLVPALGQAWADRPARRIQLEWTRGCRRATVASACPSDLFAEGAQVDFRIFEAGVQDEGEMMNGDTCSGSDRDDVSNVDCESAYDPESDGTCSNLSVLDDTLDRNSEDAMRSEAVDVDRIDSDSLTWPPSWWVSRALPHALTASRLLQHGRGGRSHLNIVPIFQKLFNNSPFSGVVEICGEAATGKTQLCLQSIATALVAEMCQCTNMTTANAICACYLHSDRAPVNRLEEIVNASIPNSCSQRQAACTVLKSIFLEHVRTPEELYSTLCKKLPKLNEQNRIRILIVDSFGAIFRQDLGNALDRSVQMFRTSALLKRISIELDIPILLTNQVMADFNADKDLQDHDLIKPALGHAWSFCVDHRITVHRSDRSRMRLGDSDGLTYSGHNMHGCAKTMSNAPCRFARVDLSSRFCGVPVPFLVSEQGVV